MVPRAGCSALSDVTRDGSLSETEQGLNASKPVQDRAKTRARTSTIHTAHIQPKLFGAPNPLKH
jgi:hypothetical protein